MKNVSRIGWLFLLLALAAGARGAVVRPAPNFAVAGAGKATTLRSFRGQPVVLVFARDARLREFRKQLARLGTLYAQFATEKAVFIAVVENGADKVPSNIPFASAADPGAVAADYGINGRFGIAVIGKDGNVDLVTQRVIPASRVRDAIFNSYENQVPARRSS